jgi:hypothetical protein
MKKDREQRPPNLVTAIRALEQVAEASGIAISRMTSGWDGATPGDGITPPPASLRRPVTPTPVATSLPSSVGSAQTLAPEEPQPRSKKPLLLGVGLLVVAAVVAVVVFAMPRGGGHEATRGAGEGSSLASHTPPPPPPADAAVAPPPVDAASVAPTPTDVIVTVRGVPDGTEVSLAGKVIGAAPGPVQLERATTAMVLTFKSEGYFPLSKTVTPDHDQDLDVQLKKRPRAVREDTRDHKDDIIDVFGKKKP